MSTNKRTLFEVHFHSHGDVQVGPRTSGSEEEPEPTTEARQGSSVSDKVFPLAVLGAALAAAFALRRARRTRELEPQPEQKNLDRWIPTR